MKSIPIPEAFGGGSFNVHFMGEYKGINMFISEGGCSCDLAGGTLSLPYKQRKEMIERGATVDEFKEAMFEYYHKFSSGPFLDNLNEIKKQL